MYVVRGGLVRYVGCPPALTSAQVMACAVVMVKCVCVKTAIQVCVIFRLPNHADKSNLCTEQDFVELLLS